MIHQMSWRLILIQEYDRIYSIKDQKRRMVCHFHGTSYWSHGDQMDHWRDQIQFHQSFLEQQKLLKCEFPDLKFQAEQQKKHHPRGIYRYVSQLCLVVDAY